MGELFFVKPHFPFWSPCKMSSALFLRPKRTHLPRFLVFGEQIRFLTARLSRRLDACFLLFAPCRSGTL